MIYVYTVTSTFSWEGGQLLKIVYGGKMFSELGVWEERAKFCH